MKNKSMNSKKTVYVFMFFAVIVFICAFLLFRTSVTAYDTPKTAYYTNICLESGDTLWEIAERYAGSSDKKVLNRYVDELMSVNQLRRCDQLKPGSYLTVIYYQ